MQKYLITFVSQTAALRFKRQAQSIGASIKIIQTPKVISYNGCSYAARLERGDLFGLLSLCRKNGIGYSRVFAESTDVNGRKHYTEIR